MSVLVTGGAGYIGSHMVLELVDRGERVIVLDDLSTGFEWAVAPQAELVIGDIGDRVLLDRLMKSRKVNTVMHFAGSIVVPDSVADPLGYYLNNTVKSRELIASAVSNGAALNEISPHSSATACATADMARLFLIASFTSLARPRSRAPHV